MSTRPKATPNKPIDWSKIFNNEVSQINACARPATGYVCDGDVREFKNADIFDTLNCPAIDKLKNPPEHYDPAYQREVNMLMMTAVLTARNIALKARDD